MKTVLASPKIMALLLFGCYCTTNGQPYTWESALELTAIPNLYMVESAYCDGYGQHLLTLDGLHARHYLFGNGGEPRSSILLCLLTRVT
jgi:hypothetical protein